MKHNIHILTELSYPDRRVLMVHSQSEANNPFKSFVRLMLPLCWWLFTKLASVIAGLTLRREQHIVGFLQQIKREQMFTKDSSKVTTWQIWNSSSHYYCLNGWVQSCPFLEECLLETAESDYSHVKYTMRRSRFHKADTAFCQSWNLVILLARLLGLQFVHSWV